MTFAASFTNGFVLAPDGQVTVGDVHVAGGRIVPTPAPDAEVIDCQGLHILPGIVDVHGDAFEAELQPRPGVEIAFDIAMHSVDRQLLANGITTAFHGLTVSWEPGARGLDAARRFMTLLPALAPDLMADHRVQLRWETHAQEAMEDLATWLGSTPPPALAFNDHTTATLDLINAGQTEPLVKWARRAAVSVDAYIAAAQRVNRPAAEIADGVAQVAALARDRGAVMLAHDEATPEARRQNRALGLKVSEFPLTPEVAKTAINAGTPVVMGAPNALRGSSHKGCLSARDAVQVGLCTVLASDYYYPAPFHAAALLVRDADMTLGAAWALVSANPAAAMGLTDRGQIAPGMRADLAIVDCSGPWRLVQCLAGDRLVRLGG